MEGRVGKVRMVNFFNTFILYFIDVPKACFRIIAKDPIVVVSRYMYSTHLLDFRSIWPARI